MISKKILENLEFNKILQKTSSFCVLSKSIEEVLNITPQETYLDAKMRLNETIEANKILYLYNVRPLSIFDDCNDILNKSKINYTLSLSEILKVNTLLRSSRVFKNSIKSLSSDQLPVFNTFANTLFESAFLENDINSKIISDEELADNATPELFTIRKKIRKLNDEIKEKLASYIRSKELTRYLQDSYVTMRSDRYVIPLKAEHKGAIKGMIHDYSASGSTIFVEPMEIVEINNDLRMLIIEESKEVEKILVNFTFNIKAIADNLIGNEKVLIYADCIMAKAIYASKNNSAAIEINNRGDIDIIRGKHPLIDTNKVIPVSINLGADFDILLISGPNTGGKTVLLKMVGLFCLMSASGFFLPCDANSKIGYFEKIFSDIGDEQSIENSLSTFSSHIVNLKYILENIDENSLVLLDEVGAGTDPQEGSALALAVLEYIVEKNSNAIITTHFTQLKEYSLATKKIKNASMEFDYETLKPNYRLKIGAPGGSKALEIAKNLGLNQSVLDNAKSKLSSDKLKFEEIIKSCEIEREEALKLKEEYLVTNQKIKKLYEEVNLEKEKLLKEKEGIKALAKIESKRLVSAATQEAEELLQSIKNIYNKSIDISSGDILDAARLRSKIENIDNNFEEERPHQVFDNLSKVDEASCKVGDAVFIKKLGSYGIITALNLKKHEASVRVGNMSTNIKLNQLLTSLELKTNLPKHSDKGGAGFFKKANTDSSKSLIELNIVGKRVHEGLAEIEEFINRTTTASMSEVRIIHGIGTGVLRKSTHEYLKTCPSVASYRLGKFGEGESGVTIVTLK